MDYLEKLLGHDAWTTRHLLDQCRRLTDEELDKPFDIGHETVRRTFAHILDNMETWTDLIAERPVRKTPKDLQSMEDLIERFERAADDLREIALEVRDSGRMGATFIDVLDQPPKAKNVETTLLHLITHSFGHRWEILHMMKCLEMQDLIEDSVLTWENQYSKM
jgi:uncharacterized damage-inducible protein DinB